MKLFVATHNQHKIREISQILPGFEIVPDDPEGVEENAPDFGAYQGAGDCREAQRRVVHGR